MPLLEGKTEVDGFEVGQEVRALSWPGTLGERFRIVEWYESPSFGLCAHVVTLNGGVRGIDSNWRYIPVGNLRPLRRRRR